MIQKVRAFRNIKMSRSQILYLTPNSKASNLRNLRAINQQLSSFRSGFSLFFRKVLCMAGLNSILRSMVMMAVMSLISALIVGAILPKGLKVKQLPKFLSVVRQKDPNANLLKILEMFENEEKMNQILAEMHGLPKNTIATQPKIDSLVINPSELEALSKMNISKELQDEIRRNYGQVGGLQDAAIERAPASVNAAPKFLMAKKDYAASLRELHKTLTVRAQKPTN